MKKILVIDDDEDMVEMLQLILTSRGYKVLASPNGAFFSEMSKDMPDLILLDVLLSGEDGREICQRLKSSDQTRHIPVILFSAHSNLSNATASRYGADEFLSKPFDLDELLDIVKKHLSGRFPIPQGE